MRSFLLLLTLCAALSAPGAGAAQPAAPQAPCDGMSAPYPAFAAAGAPPATAVWHDVTLDAAAGCGSRLQGEMNLVVALAGSFRFAGTLDDLAARAGAISKTVGTLYWSTNEQKWRPLISEAAALTGPDGDWSHGALRRADFTAAELRSGNTLWFVQNDTRSTGANLYRMRTVEATPEDLAVEVVNESPIDFMVLTLFDPRELLSLHVVRHLGGDLWGYYGLTAIHRVTLEDYGKSMLNRNAAFFRFLQGQPGDAGPPVAQ